MKEQDLTPSVAKETTSIIPDVSIDEKVKSFTPEKKESEYKRIAGIKSGERTKADKEIFLLLKLIKAEDKKQKQEEKAKEAQKRLEAFRNPTQKTEARKKYLLGSAYLDLFNKDDKFKKKALEYLDEYLTREKDREVFDLPEK